MLREETRGVFAVLPTAALKWIVFELCKEAVHSEKVPPSSSESLVSRQKQPSTEQGLGSEGGEKGNYI